MVIYKRSSWTKLCTAIAIFTLLLVTHEVCFAEVKIPTLSLNLGETDGPDGVVPALKIVGLITILSVAPAILLMMTSFTRILIVLSFVRQALGTQTMPPNQVLIGLSLFLTIFTMGPIWDVIDKNAFQPYIQKQIGEEAAIEKFIVPVRSFMFKETRSEDLALFFQVSGMQQPQIKQDIPLSVLMPAFMISELKTAFQIGFLIYIPFLVIDMVISSILMAMGMMMLPPTVVSLPFKLVLFVLVDGWSLIISSVMKSFHSF
ncbi:MAG: flagellar type III secretion system pore protein FliP [Zetaproteobacteria bacterium]|nr:flagellar type III secretion system pore protein FliP [Zetaproteobacteria bacterium]